MPGPIGGYEPVVILDGLSVLEIVKEVGGPTETGRFVVADRLCDAAAPCAVGDRAAADGHRPHHRRRDRHTGALMCSRCRNHDRFEETSS